MIMIFIQEFWYYISNILLIVVYSLNSSDLGSTLRRSKLSNSQIIKSFHDSMYALTACLCGYIQPGDGFEDTFRMSTCHMVRAPGMLLLSKPISWQFLFMIERWHAAVKQSKNCVWSVCVGDIQIVNMCHSRVVASNYTYDIYFALKIKNGKQLAFLRSVYT